MLKTNNAGSAEAGAIMSRFFPYLDPHQVVKILCWGKLNGLFADAEVDPALRKLLETHPIVWPYETLGWAIPAAAENKQREQQNLYVSLEERLSPLYGNLASTRAEYQDQLTKANTTRMAPRPPPLERQPLAVWNQKREVKVQALKAELETLPEDAPENVRKDLESKIATMSQPFSPSALEDMRVYSKAFYHGGDYAGLLDRARFYLDCICDLVLEASKDLASREEFLWGLLLAACMVEGEQGSKDIAFVPEAVTRLDEVFENMCSSRGVTKLEEKAALDKKNLGLTTYLMHWVVWPLFRHYFSASARGAAASRTAAWNELVDWFLGEKQQQCVALIAPHLLRYYAVIAILNRKNDSIVRAATQAVNNGAHLYQDAITRLVTSIFTDCDFEQSQNELPKIASLCRKDFFLENLSQEIEEQARLLVFDNYCRTHRSINIGMLSDRLNMNGEEAEKWIVNLIMDSKLDAKIDSEKNVIEMAPNFPSYHAQILERTRKLIFRSQNIIQMIQARTKAT